MDSLASAADTSRDVADAKAMAEERVHQRQWQQKLLPLMVRMLLGIAVFFFMASIAQLAYMHWRIDQTSRLDLREPTQLLLAATGSPDLDRSERATLLIRGLLEADVIERRHHQARVMLMARVWTVYMGFVTGMSLALTGAAFILGRVHGSTTTVKFDAALIKAEATASAPGMLMAFLGVVLMLVTILVNHTIVVEDRNIYFRIDEVASPISATPNPAYSGASKPAFPSISVPEVSGSIKRAE